MVFRQRTYSVLVVSNSDGFNNSIQALLPMTDYWPVTVAGSVSAARRRLLEQEYDLVLINAPLPDDLGLRLALDLSDSSDAVALIFVKAELYDEVLLKATDHGVIAVAKPTTRPVINQYLLAMQAMRERLRARKDKIVTLEEKMEQIRLVNRAKLLLIEREGLTEDEAHRAIEKQAMDRRVSKREVAERIIRTYGV